MLTIFSPDHMTGGNQELSQNTLFKLVLFAIIIINNIVHIIIYRHLAEEIRGEYSDRSDKGDGVDDLVALAKEIIPYNMQHNAETEACDLLMEIEQLDLLEQYVDQNSFQRVCLYLTRSVTLFSYMYDNLKLRL